MDKRTVAGIRVGGLGSGLQFRVSSFEFSSFEARVGETTSLLVSLPKVRFLDNLAAVLFGVLPQCPDGAFFFSDQVLKFLVDAHDLTVIPGAEQF
jgi:hypothetical protein